MKPLAKVLVLVGVLILRLTVTTFSQEVEGEFTASTAVPASMVTAAKVTLVDLEHSLDGGKTFSPRYSYKLQLSKSAVKLVDLQPEKNGIFASDIESFRSLLMGNTADGLYRIRMHSTPSDPTSPYVSAAIPSCELQKSGFKEDIVLHLDSSNNIVGVGYSSPVIALSRPCDPSALKSPTPLLTRFRAGEVHSGQSIPVQAIGPVPTVYGKVDVLAEVNGQPKPPVQKSFLQRYWYVVIIMIYYLLKTQPEAPVAAVAPEGKKK